MKAGILFIAILYSARCAYCVMDSTYFSTSAEIHYGFIIPHSFVVEPVSHTRPLGVTLKFNWLHTSYESRKVFNANWISGFRAGYFNFQNREVLGGAYLLSGFVEPVIFHTPKWFLSLSGGAGISLHTRIYNAVDNPMNNFFSTRLSFPLYISPGFSLKMMDNFVATLSGNYNHISNGGIKQPNYGMNFPTISVGMRYLPEGIPQLSRSDYKGAGVNYSGISLLIQANTAYKVVDRTDVFPEKRTLACGFHTRAMKQLSYFYSLNAGIEIVFDGALKEAIKRENLDVDYTRFSLTAGQDFTFGKAVFTQYFGFYLYSPYEAKSSFYQKYELAYCLNRHILAGVFIKAHSYVADMMGFSINYILSKK